MRSTKKASNTQLTEQIAEAIRMGEFRAGEWLRQIDLEEKYKATRFDIRRALDALVLHNTIEHVSNRGYRVAQISEETQQAIEQTRMIVETAAAELVIKHITDTDIAALKQLAEAFSQTITSGTALEQSLTNRNFHRLFFSLCKNPILEDVIWSLRERSRITTFTTWKSLEGQLLADRDHYEIIDALLQRDALRLMALVKQHTTRN